MNILITGGTGLLGKEICRQLSFQKEYTIRCLVRKISSELPDHIEQIEGDILDVPSINRALANIDIVIHSAALVSFHKKDKGKLFQTNIEGTANIVNSCLDSSVSKLIHVSSVASLGKPEKVIDAIEEVSIDESHKWQDSPLNSIYAQSKYLGELEVWRAQAEGLHTVIINPSVILGEGEWSQSSTQLFNYVRKKNKFYSNGFINYVDVQDVAYALIALMKSELSGQRYILNGGKVSYKTFFEKIAIQMKKPVPNIKLEKGMIAILWRAERIRSFLFGSKPLITQETALSARSNLYYSNLKIKKALNMEFQPLDDSIRRVTDYLSQKE